MLSGEGSCIFGSVVRVRFCGSLPVMGFLDTDRSHSMFCKGLLLKRGKKI